MLYQQIFTYSVVVVSAVTVNYKRIAGVREMAIHHTTDKAHPRIRQTIHRFRNEGQRCSALRLDSKRRRYVYGFGNDVAVAVGGARANRSGDVARFTETAEHNSSLIAWNFG